MSKHYEMVIAELRMEAGVLLHLAQEMELRKGPANATETLGGGTKVAVGATELPKGETVLAAAATTGSGEPRRVRKYTRQGQVSITSLVEEAINGTTRLFSGKELLPLVRKKAKSANLAAVNWGIRESMRRGQVVRTEGRGNYVLKALAAGKETAPTRNTADPEKRLALLKIVAMEELPTHGREWTRVELWKEIQASHPELAREVEDGELGKVLRELKAEGRVEMVQEPGPGTIAVYRSK